MEDNLKQAASYLFEGVDSIIQSLTPRKRIDIDDIMIVYIDNVNGKFKCRSSYSLLDIWAYLRDGSKPVGVIFMSWTDAEHMKVKEFPNLSEEEQSLLAHAFAEAQDEHRVEDVE
jgi:hypothetical protein